MKTKLIFTIFLFSACLFSIAAFSQTVPGGGSECPTSYSIKKSNGNGSGGCNGEAEIRVTFLQMPSPQDIPSITAIEYQAQPVTNIALPAKGILVNNGQGYISYCISASTSKNNGNSFAKLPPAAKIVLELTTQTGVVCRTDNIQ